MSGDNSLGWKRCFLHILLGQAVALLNSVTGVSTTKLIINGASYPLLQSLTAYAFVFLVYGPLFMILYIRNKEKKFANYSFFQRFWKYAILAIIDLEANFVIVKAYQYTDMMSAQLLGCFTIPCVLVLSYFILKMRFSITHIVGCIIGTGGLSLLIALDADGLSRDFVGPDILKGDLLAVLASVLYATSNVLMEWFIKPKTRDVVVATGTEQSSVPDNEEVCTTDRSAQGSYPRTSANQSIHNPDGCSTAPDIDHHPSEVLPDVPKFIPLCENMCCMSGFALIFATIQFFAVEWSTFEPRRGSWTKDDSLFQIVFGLTMLCVYTGMPTLFLLTSAAFANISLLAVNIYSVIWNVAVFGVRPKPIFFVPYVIIIGGTIIYELSDIPWRWCPVYNYPCGDTRVFSDDDSDEANR